MSSNEYDVIKKIQAAVRGHLTRKKLGVNNLDSSALTTYIPFLIGNDRPLNQQDLKPYQFNVPFVLVGTSMFRSIDFACKLAGTDVIPKVIIVDNSGEVFKSWIKLKRFFTETQLTDKNEILRSDEGLLAFIINELHETTRGENAYKYFSDFFKLYSVEYVKKVVMSTAIVRQSWADEDTFTKIKEIYSDMPIVAYSSNIISYVDTSIEQAQVLKCMGILKPSLCIYSNLDKQLNIPTKTFVLRDFSPLIIAESLGLTEVVPMETSEDTLAKKV